MATTYKMAKRLTEARVRRILKLAAGEVKDSQRRTWLLYDERGTWEARVRELYQQASEHRLFPSTPDAEVNNQISIMVALDATEAALKLAKRKR